MAKETQAFLMKRIVRAGLLGAAAASAMAAGYAAVDNVRASPALIEQVHDAHVAHPLESTAPTDDVFVKRGWAALVAGVLGALMGWFPRSTQTIAQVAGVVGRASVSTAQAAARASVGAAKTIRKAAKLGMPALLGLSGAAFLGYALLEHAFGVPGALSLILLFSAAALGVRRMQQARASSA